MTADEPPTARGDVNDQPLACNGNTAAAATATAAAAVETRRQHQQHCSRMRALRGRVICCSGRYIVSQQRRESRLFVLKAEVGATREASMSVCLCLAQRQKIRSISQ